MNDRKVMKEAIEELQYALSKVTAENEALHQKLAKKDSEITHLKFDLLLPTQTQLAAAQLREQRLREALEDLASCMTGVIEGDYKPDSFTLQPTRLALTLPSDTALREMIQKAGEVMRRQSICIIENAKVFSDVDLTLRRSQNEIRGLPGVTLEDLK